MTNDKYEGLRNFPNQDPNMPTSPYEISKEKRHKNY